jgi:hypothetical protein
VSNDEILQQARQEYEELSGVGGAKQPIDDLNLAFERRRTVARQMMAEAQLLEQRNNETLRMLAAQRIQVGNVEAVRLAVVLDHLLGDTDNPKRAEFELRFQQILAAQLEMAAGQVNRAKLTAPAGPVGLPANGARLILPGG